MLLARRTCDWLLPTPPTPLKQAIAPPPAFDTVLLRTWICPNHEKGVGSRYTPWPPVVWMMLFARSRLAFGRCVDVDAVPPDVVNEVVADVELVARRRRAEDDPVGSGAAAPLDLQPLECHVVVEEEDGPVAETFASLSSTTPVPGGRGAG